MNNNNIQQTLNALIPMPQIVNIVNRITPSLVSLGIFFLAVGLVFHFARGDSLMQALVGTICLCACMVIAPFLLSLVETSRWHAGKRYCFRRAKHGLVASP
jgi:hypothetical protein